MSNLIKRFEQYIHLKEKLKNELDTNINAIEEEASSLFVHHSFKRKVEYLEEKLQSKEMDTYDALELMYSFGKHKAFEEVQNMIYEFDKPESAYDIDGVLK